MRPLHRTLSLGFGIATAIALATVACGQTLPTANLSCPCESGWTCCAGDNICVPPGTKCASADADTVADASQCPIGITIGMSTVPTFGADGSVEPFPQGLSMTGQVLSTVPFGGATMSFNYAQSTTIEGGAMQEKGWIVEGGNTQRYRFDVYANDGTTRLGLQLAIYGPIEIGPASDQCFAPLVDNGPIAAGSGMFSPPVWGKYFVAAYHPIELAGNGMISIESYDDPTYSNAVLSMTPIDD